jgi:hypothetical protein
VAICVTPILYALEVALLALGLLLELELLELLPQPATTPATALAASSATSRTTLDTRGIRGSPFDHKTSAAF